ncbi:alpha-L-fucosidase [Microbacterium sp. PMB16]|uniref:alpha-L-fucosidase n=1 Tax=Microbacterium sp. PMB16 TaxID=3120157 RepID=UPI003F4B48C2
MMKARRSATVSASLAAVAALTLGLLVASPASAAPKPQYAVGHLAVGKPATQSSTLGASAALAVDGNRDGAYAAGSVTHTNSDAQAWWQVDLQAETAVGNVVVWNRSDWDIQGLGQGSPACCGGRLQDYWVLASSTPFASTDLNAARAQAGVTAVHVAGTGTKSTVAIARSARYIRVQLAGTGYLSLSEVEVQSPGDSPAKPLHRNLALGAASSQSSTYSTGVATNAQDGIVTGDWAKGSVSHTGTGANEWWQADLRSVKQLTTVRVWGRTGCCTERTSDFYVLASDVPFTSTNLAQTLAQPGVTAKRVQNMGRSGEVTLNRSARYIRVQSNRTDYLNLAEVEIFDAGPPAAPANGAAQALQLDFGMFIHYNMSTYTGQEWATPGTPASTFNPTSVDTDQWAAAAASAGMKYGVLTTKHHDGFALWNTASNSYDVASSGFTQDIVAKYATSFRGAGLKVGLYYSICDRTNGETQQLIHNQLRELLTGYGEISQIWFDCLGWENNNEPWATSFSEVDSEQILAFIRNISPGTTIVNNDHWDTVGTTDLSSFEYTVPAADRTKPTQRAETIGGTWFNNSAATPRSTADIMGRLTFLRGEGYQYLLNVGPGRDGRLSAAIVSRLAEVGAAGGIR